MAGAIGANALEKRHERYVPSIFFLPLFIIVFLSIPPRFKKPFTNQHKNRHKRASSSDNRRDRDHSPGGLRGAISGFLDPHRGDERRSRSSAGERRRRGASVSEEEVVIRRGGEKWR